jgi:hypothetical protein
MLDKVVLEFMQVAAEVLLQALMEFQLLADMVAAD